MRGVVDLSEDGIVGVVYGAVHNGLSRTITSCPSEGRAVHQLAPDFKSVVVFDLIRRCRRNTTGLRQRALQLCRRACASSRFKPNSEIWRSSSSTGPANLARALQTGACDWRVLHVDEVEHDDSAEVSQTDLANDLLRRFEFVLNTVSSRFLLPTYLPCSHRSRPAPRFD